jgi:hypothetical protein
MPHGTISQGVKSALETLDDEDSILRLKVGIDILRLTGEFPTFSYRAVLYHIIPRHVRIYSLLCVSLPYFNALFYFISFHSRRCGIAVVGDMVGYGGGGTTVGSGKGS